MARYFLISLGPAIVTFALTAVLPMAAAGALGIAVAIAAVVLGERLTAHRPAIAAKTARRDLAHAVLSSGTAQVCLVVGTALMGVAARPRVSWPLAIQVALIVVGSDLLGYVAHRAQHRFAPLWGPHAIHHMPTELYWLNGLRAHPGDTAWAFTFATAWALAAGFTEQAFVVAATITTSHLLLQHTRMVFPRWLEAVFVTPAWHRVHHDRAVQRDASNLGKVLTIWDRMFGTFRSSTPPPADLGIAEECDDSLLAELSFGLGRG